MERLTKHSKQTSHENGICCTHFRGPECLRVGGNCAMNCKWEESAWSRLAAYEDTRLEPEEIDMDHEAAEQLRQLCQGCDLDRLEELAEADKDGRLVVLPCKVGDTVWAVSGKIIKCEIEETYLYDGGGIEYFVTFDCDGADCKGCPFNRWEQDCSGERYCKCEYGCSSFKDSDIGKTVFFTHEEAEAALEAMKDE